MPRLAMLLVLSFVLLLGARPSYAAASPAYSLKASVSPSGDIQVVLRGENLTDLYAFDATLSYDTARLRFKKAASAMPGMSTAPIESEGTVRFAHTMIGPVAGKKGSTELATLLFEPVGTGTARISLASLKTVDSALKMETVSVSAAVSIPVASTAASFRDVDAKWSWAAEAISELSKLGIVNGTGQGLFEPGKPVKRGDLALMAVRAFGIEGGAAAEAFPDVAPGKYYASAIGSLRAAGILNGDADGRFRPESSVTRQELMTMLDRALATIGRPLAESDAQAALAAFSDREALSAYAIEPAARLVSSGIVKGSRDRLMPQASTTRAELAVLLHRMLAMMG